MDRRSVIKNSLMALAVSFLPKVLQPSVPEVEDEPVSKNEFLKIEWEGDAYEHVQEMMKKYAGNHENYFYFAAGEKYSLGEVYYDGSSLNKT